MIRLRSNNDPTGRQILSPPGRFKNDCGKLAYSRTCGPRAETTRVPRVDNWSRRRRRRHNDGNGSSNSKIGRRRLRPRRSWPSNGQQQRRRRRPQNETRNIDAMGHVERAISRSCPCCWDDFRGLTEHCFGKKLNKIGSTTRPIVGHDASVEIATCHDDTHEVGPTTTTRCFPVPLCETKRPRNATVC